MKTYQQAYGHTCTHLCTCIHLCTCMHTLHTNPSTQNDKVVTKSKNKDLKLTKKAFPYQDLM